MQILANGLIQGLLLSIISLGFALVYNSTGILHIAQGAVFAISPFLLLSFIQSGVGIPIAIFLTLSISVILSMLFEFVNHWPLHRRGF